MGDDEKAPPAAPLNILSAEEIAEIRRQVREIAAKERKARRRKTPPWNPDADQPWRPLDHVFVGALKGCDDITTRDLETILARGEVPYTGNRDDMIGDLPARIEKLVAAAERRLFFFEDNSILATYAERPDRAALFGQKSALLHGRWPTITFSSVRVHWPKFIETSQEAGFQISATPKHGKCRGVQPSQTVQVGITSAHRTRGRKPEKFNATVARMREDLSSGRLTPDALDAKLEKELETDYGVSRDVARRARNQILSDSPRLHEKLVTR